MAVLLLDVYPVVQASIRSACRATAAASQPSDNCKYRGVRFLSSQGREWNPYFCLSRATRSEIFLRYSSGA